ncbi:zinc-finger domain-containing protein [Bartonella sp. DGB2]|uniref:zinc-finger domain-containing protein n=1 Tax=Bartonella sp. DGB2 TaxID=3388426 RepID=UPI00398FEF12
MADHSIPHFHNDSGYKIIEIGVKEFMCIGASPPFDHPHIYIDMGDAIEKICPYCSTLYRYNPNLKSEETTPAGCIYSTAD